MSHVFTDSNFESMVIKSDKLTIVDFWATWCPPCIALGPIIDSIAHDYAQSILVGKVNADDNPNVSIHYGVTNLPCVLFFYNGQLIDRQVGAASKAAYVRKIERLLETTKTKL